MSKKAELTPEELEFVLAVLRVFPHQGNAEQLARIVSLTEGAIKKLEARTQAEKG